MSTGRGTVNGEVITSSQTFDLADKSEGAGVWQPTVVNTGNVPVKIFGFYTLQPNSSPFRIELPFAVTNSIKILFMEDSSIENPKKEIVIWYGVKQCP